MNKIILTITMITLLLSSPPLAWAVQWDKKDVGENKLKVEGECAGEQVTVYIYPKAGGESIYSAGVRCEDGRFVLKDDLTPWNIQTDSYKIVVGERQRPDFSKIEELSVLQDLLGGSSNSTGQTQTLQDPNQEFNQATGNFSTQLQGLNSSLTEIKQTLPDTNFTSPVKTVISAFLSTIETAISKIAQGFDSLIGLLSDKVPVPLNAPFEGSFTVTNNFGEKSDDPLIIENDNKLGLKGHDGVDFKMPVGTPIFAADDGEVVPVEGEGYGTTLVIKHSWGKSFYGHLSSTLVGEGDKVTRGEKIAMSGNSGLSTGSHLHFGIRLNHFNNENGYLGKIDPLPYLQLTKAEASPRATPAPQPKADESLVQTPVPSSTPVPVLSASPSVSPSASSSAALSQTLTVNQNELGFLRVRNDPSASSEEIAQVSPGQTFTIIDSQNNWYKIEYSSGQFGWVSGVYVTAN